MRFIARVDIDTGSPVYVDDNVLLNLTLVLQETSFKYKSRVRKSQAGYRIMNSINTDPPSLSRICGPHQKRESGNPSDTAAKPEAPEAPLGWGKYAAAKANKFLGGLDWARKVTSGNAYPNISRVTGNPFLGLMREADPQTDGFQRTIQRVYDAGSDRGAAYCWFATQPVVVLHPALVVKFLSSENSDSVSRVGLDTMGPFGSLHRIAGPGVFTSEGDSWRLMRNQLAAAFKTESALRDKFRVMVETTSSHLASMRSGGELNLNKTFTAYTMDVAARAGLGVQTIAGVTETMSGLLSQVVQLSMNVDHTIKHILLAKVCGQNVKVPDSVERELGNKLRSFFAEVLEENKERIDPSGTAPRNILQDISLASGGTTDVPITETVAQQGGIILGAAHETTASLLLWTTIELFKHPMVLTKVTEEIQREWVPSQTFECLNKMRYLDNVLNEVLRLHPPIPNTSRGLLRRVGISLGAGAGTLVLEPGAFVVVPHYSIHHDPAVWGPDANEFEPDRWAGVDPLQKIKEGKFLAFGLGSRSCPGFRFSLKEVKILLSMLLPNHRLDLAEPHKITERFPGTLKTATPVLGTIRREASE